MLLKPSVHVGDISNQGLLSPQSSPIAEYEPGYCRLTQRGKDQVCVTKSIMYFKVLMVIVLMLVCRIRKFVLIGEAISRTVARKSLRF